MLERHGGTVEKFIGDAVVAAFGVPQVHEDDALRACRAALEIQELLSPRIALRIGVNTGEVVSGDPSARETFVTGDAVNVAARLEQAAPLGGVLIGESTYRLVRDAVTRRGGRAAGGEGKVGAAGCVPAARGRERAFGVGSGEPAGRARCGAGAARARVRRRRCRTSLPSGDGRR